MKGFVQIPILIAIFVSAIVFGGGGYLVAEKISQSPQLGVQESQIVVETTASSTEAVATTSVQTSTQIVKPKVNVSVPVEVSKTSQTIVAPTQTTQIKTETKSSVLFQISNVESNTSKHSAIIDWETALPARSRLALKIGSNDEKVYESVKDVGIQHRVEIADLSPSIEYSYHITAKSLDENAQEDDLYGSFRTQREFKISLVGQNDGCQIISVIDTADNPLIDATVTVRGSYVTGNITSYKPAVSLRSDSMGRVKYCYATANKFEISTQGLSVTLQ